MNVEQIAVASGFSICKVTGAWSGGVSCRRELEKFAELVRASVRKEDVHVLGFCHPRNGAPAYGGGYQKGWMDALRSAEWAIEALQEIARQAKEQP